MAQVLPKQVRSLRGKKAQRLRSPIKRVQPLNPRRKRSR